MKYEQIKYQLMAEPHMKPGYAIVLVAPVDYQKVGDELINKVSLWESIKDETGFPIGQIKRLKRDVK